MTRDSWDSPSLRSSSTLIVWLVTASIFATFLLFQLPTQLSTNPAYLIRVHNGAVASENKRCSDIGVDVLKDGGNAVDAAIAATLCIGVVNMFSSVSGINGSPNLLLTHSVLGLVSVAVDS
jgi:Gamma-glutamyltranspeptidase